MKIGEIIDITFNGIEMHIKFNGKINLLAGYSGTGKTLLMKALILQCTKKGIPYRYLDYKNKGMSEEEIASYCNGAKVIMLDNADLYLTDKLLNEISKSADIIVMSLKQTYMISMDKVKRYIVNYENMKLELEEF